MPQATEMGHAQTAAAQRDFWIALPTAGRGCHSDRCFPAVLKKPKPGRNSGPAVGGNTSKKQVRSVRITHTTDRPAKPVSATDARGDDHRSDTHLVTDPNWLELPGCTTPRSCDRTRAETVTFDAPRSPTPHRSHCRPRRRRPHTAIAPAVLRDCRRPRCCQRYHPNAAPLAVPTVELPPWMVTSRHGYDLAFFDGLSAANFAGAEGIVALMGGAGRNHQTYHDSHSSVADHHAIIRVHD